MASGNNLLSSPYHHHHRHHPRSQSPTCRSRDPSRFFTILHDPSRSFTVLHDPSRSLTIPHDPSRSFTIPQRSFTILHDPPTISTPLYSYPSFTPLDGGGRFFFFNFLNFRNFRNFYSFISIYYCVRCAALCVRALLYGEITLVFCGVFYFSFFSFSFLPRVFTLLAPLFFFFLFFF